MLVVLACIGCSKLPFIIVVHLVLLSNCMVMNSNIIIMYAVLKTLDISVLFIDTILLSNKIMLTYVLLLLLLL